MHWLMVLFLILPGMAQAADLIATRMIRATEVIGPADLTVPPGMEAAQSDALRAAAIGLEARVTIYPGRPVRLADLVPPAMVGRNELVRMRFQRAGLVIFSEGRALARAAQGEVVTVMNLASRQSVQGVVVGAGLIDVSQ